MRDDVIDRIASHYNVREAVHGKKAGMFGGLLERFSRDREGPTDAIAVSSTEVPGLPAMAPIAQRRWTG